MKGQGIMQIRHAGPVRVIALAALTLASVFVSAPSAAAADEHVRGVITVRNGATFTMQTEAAESLIVTLGDATRIKLTSGKHMSASELTPGLRIKVDGSFDDQHRLVADEIKFTRKDHKVAVAIKAGLTPTDAQVAANRVDLQKDAFALQQHAQALEAHVQTLHAHQEEITANDLKMVGTTGALGTRLDNLDDYNVVDTFIVYFKNGRSAVDVVYGRQLQDFAAKAKGLSGYKVQVQGYASAVGSRMRNERLSAGRADAVTAVLQQRGAIPPANMFAPAAMGISEQFAKNNTTQGQAENRRVIVTILQNKGISER